MRVLNDAAKALVAGLQSGGASTGVSLAAALAADDLPVKAEDVVLAAVQHVVGTSAECAADPALTRKLFEAVRWSWLSPPMLRHVEAELEARAAPVAGAGSRPFPLAFPDALVPRISRALLARSRRQAAAAGQCPWGAAYRCGDAGDDAFPPRHAYGFSVDANGISRLGSGIGPYFCWVDPRAPTAANDPWASSAEAPMPGALPVRYRANIAAWQAAYGGPTIASADASGSCAARQPGVPSAHPVAVFNGAQCAAAVREAGCHPEFAAASGVHVPMPAAADSSAAVASASVPPSRNPLYDLYTALAVSGAWIQCVDIARLAIAWLGGGGSTYIDTDMQVGTHRLPDAFMQPRPPSLVARLHGEAPPAAAAAAAAVPVPLLCLPQDADGVLQNNFIAQAGATPHHPVLTALLRACMLCAVPEQHVVQGTGPALITAAVTCLHDLPVAATPSVSSWLAGSGVLMSDVSEPLPLLARTQTRAWRRALPPPLPAASFPYLSRVPRLVPDAGEVVDGAHSSCVLQCVPTASASHASPAPLVFGDCVHVMPPASFFPQHWRQADPVAASLASVPGGSARAQMPASGVGGDATPLTGAGVAPRPAFWDPAALSAASNDSLVVGGGSRADGYDTGDVDTGGENGCEALTADAEAAAVREVARLMAAVGDPRGLRWGDNDAATPGISSFAASPLEWRWTADGIPLFGMHAWDCTWGSYPATGAAKPGYASGYASAGSDYAAAAAYAGASGYGYATVAIVVPAAAASDVGAGFGPMLAHGRVTLAEVRRLATYLGAATTGDPAAALASSSVGTALAGGAASVGAGTIAHDPFRDTRAGHVATVDTLASSDIFGVVGLSQRLVVRMHAAGWL